MTAAAFTSCVDNELPGYSVEKPQSIAQYEYLNDYDALKTYVDRSANPNFKLGLALAANEYNEKGLVYRLANSNFDEIVAGNAMKYASVVSETGAMNFGTVQSFVETAQETGMSIYGHTLAWHAQQGKYPASLLKDRELPPVKAEGYCFHINTSEAKANPWDWQMLYDLDTPMKAGVTYEFSIRVKASTASQFNFWIETPNAGNTHYGQPMIDCPTQWGTTSFEMTPNSDCSRLLFCFGQYGGDLYFDDITLVEKGTEENMIVNGNFNSKEMPANWSKPGWHGHTYEIVEAIADAAVMVEVEVEEDRTCVVVESDDMVDAAWDTQFWIMVDESTPFVTGDSWSVSMDVRADKKASAGTQTHTNAGGYIHWAAIGTVNFTPEWNTYTAEGTFTSEQNGGYSIAFNLNDFPEGNKYYFDNISFKVNGVEMVKNGDCDDLSNNVSFVAKEKRGATVGATIVDHIKYKILKSSNSIPLTPEEKKDTLIWAMNTWIEGMMKATGGYVKAWDAVNESISGTDLDGDGYYDLQSVATGGSNTDFFWQEYLGSEDYVPVVTKAAEKYFVEAGGNASDLKLFINDYNLESWWDGNKKLKSLIHWIEVWEANGAKIDGIGTQMHVSYILNEADQKAQENAIVEMFKLMAATKKLVKISELDMGIVENAFGPGIKSADVTFEQQQKMAEFYKFIVSKYFEIIPVAQQYSITQWCATDAPASSGWRGGEPVGLWDLNYNRKPAYGGFADGLAGK